MTIGGEGHSQKCKQNSSKKVYLVVEGLQVTSIVQGVWILDLDVAATGGGGGGQAVDVNGRQHLFTQSGFTSKIRNQSANINTNLFVCVTECTQQHNRTTTRTNLHKYMPT